MRLGHKVSGRALVRALGMTTTAALAVTLAACSSSSSTGTHVTSTQKAHAAHSSAPAAPASSAPAAAAGALSGRWSGQYSGAYQGTFILRWVQSGAHLTGRIHISNPGSTLGIRGTVSGGSIQFGTVGGAAITYTGTVSGNSMSGTYKVSNGSGTVGGPWSASRS